MEKQFLRGEMRQKSLRNGILLLENRIPSVKNAIRPVQNDISVLWNGIPFLKNRVPSVKYVIRRIGNPVFHITNQILSNKIPIRR